jgi:Cys-rich protein (TIGR01571 family)
MEDEIETKHSVVVGRTEETEIEDGRQKRNVDVLHIELSRNEDITAAKQQSSSETVAAAEIEDAEREIHHSDKAKLITGQNTGPSSSSDQKPTSPQSNDETQPCKPSQQFSVNLFSIGDPKQCMFSWCCSPCALASARSQLDGSSQCFNLMCVNTFTTRFLVRSAYDISGSNYDDLTLSCCCVPCATNQVYQTVIKNGKREPNRMFVRTALDADCSQAFTCDQLGASLCCFPCMTAMATSNALHGLPLPLALCCISPCTNANIIRYHYGNTSGEWSCLDDCVALTAMYPLTLLMCLIPCQWRYYGKMVVNIGHNALEQVDRGSSNKAYLHPI